MYCFVLGNPCKKFADVKGAEEAVKAMDGKEIAGDRVVVEIAGMLSLIIGRK